MNYFDLINKCLVELNYKTCSDFSDLVKNDHEKIKNILNIINAEVCSFDNWNFLLRKLDLIFPKNTGEIINSVQGRIHSLYINQRRLNYVSDFEDFLLNKPKSDTFSVFNDKILLPFYDEDKTINVVYYTNNFAQDANGLDISSMSEKDDVTIIPFPFAEPILVYGTCMRLKGNADNSKFSYWYGMYKDALSNLRAKVGANALETPQINVTRN